MTHCRICQAKVTPFISFGKQPLGNGFLKTEEFKEEYFFELAAGVCESCWMVQLLEQPDPKKMFHDAYAFFSGTSKYMTEHFKGFAKNILAEFAAKPGALVVELGSNDGILLKNFKAAGVACLGIEPSGNVAKHAEAAGIESWVEFFSPEIATQIVAKKGKVDAFLSANCMCHIPDFNSLIDGFAIALKEDGIIAFEDPYMAQVLQKTSYDQFYDEHVFLFSATSVKNAFARKGFDLFRVEEQVTHGGSMRYYLCRKGKRPIEKSVQQALATEESLGMKTLWAYENFKSNCELSKKNLMQVLRDLKKAGKRVVGYAATSKSTTVINYCGITPDLVEFISDTTPIKQGKFSPGMHIPVKPDTNFRASYPDFALLFGWNHEKEILKKETDYTESGGQWIVYVPEVTIR